jgi:thiamine transport system substrate-binding protein
MKTGFANLLLAFILLIFLLGCVEEKKPDLVVYTYDSFASEYGLGPKIVPLFEKECNCKVRLSSKGDAGQMLNALILEKDNPKADVVIGIDNSMASVAIKSGVLEKFVPRNVSIVPKELIFDSESYLIPFDYGYFAFIYDSNKIDFSLNSFDSLLDERLEGKVVIQNPRTSSPGLGLLLWTVAVYGDPGYKDFWRKFRKNVLTVTESWDQSAGLFSAGEALIYLSYATSPPYYVQFENKKNYIAADFTEGHYLQVEGIGIVKSSKNRFLAEKFVEFSLMESFQKEIPLSQFMFPVNKRVALPESFKYALKPKKQLSLDPLLVAEKQEEWVSEWEKIMRAG